MGRTYVGRGRENQSSQGQITTHVEFLNSPRMKCNIVINCWFIEPETLHLAKTLAESALDEDCSDIMMFCTGRSLQPFFKFCQVHVKISENLGKHYHWLFSAPNPQTISMTSSKAAEAAEAGELESSPRATRVRLTMAAPAGRSQILIQFWNSRMGFTSTFAPKCLLWSLMLPELKFPCILLGSKQETTAIWMREGDGAFQYDTMENI